MSARFGITLKHVKLADTAEAVTRVLAEKTAGRDEGGSIDLIWINGENFASMKEQDLLHGPFVEDLPNFAHVDVAGKPTTVLDFTVPTDGLEAPWGMAQFVFFHDQARIAEPPRSVADLLDWAKANPGRFTHPSPPDFIGSTFLKHLMIAYIDDPAVLQEPVDDADFMEVTAGLWQALEDVRPSLWRQGETYPANGPGLHQLLDDGEVDFSMAFNPAEASAAINAGTLPDSVRTFIPEAGSIGNTHFVAIPFNAAHRAGAEVVADFLMSPEAQAKKQDPEGWGDWHRARRRQPRSGRPCALRGFAARYRDLVAAGTDAGPARAASLLDDAGSKRSGCAASAADDACGRAREPSPGDRR